MNEYIWVILHFVGEVETIRCGYYTQKRAYEELDFIRSNPANTLYDFDTEWRIEKVTMADFVGLEASRKPR